MKLEAYKDGKRFATIEHQDITTKQLMPVIDNLINNGHGCTLVTDGPLNISLQVRENSVPFANDLLWQATQEAKK